MLGRTLLGALPLLGAVLAQQQLTYSDADGLPFQGIYDEVIDSHFGWLFPTSTTGTEFIGEFIVPITQKWAGISLGGGMTNNPLIVAWPYNGKIVFTTRFATDYVYPALYSGPVITTLPYTTINSTHWRWVYRCQNCVSWTNSYGGGSINQASSGAIGYVTSEQSVDTPSSASSTFVEHTYDTITGLDLSLSHNANYQNYLSGGPSTTTTTTSTKTTTTTSSTSTTSTALPTFSPAYDYIVVGAGYGGIISADRLSQAGKKVLLIERGGPSYGITGGTYQASWAKGTNYTKFDVPGLFESEFNDNNQFWWCNDIGYLAGCLIGGGSAINGMLYWYPSPEDFSTGNGWPSSWGNIQPATAKVTARLPSTIHPSTDGKFYLDQTFTVVSNFLAKDGYSNISINSNVGFKDHAMGQSEYGVMNGLRAGPVVSYLQTAQSRSNFKLISNTTVQAVVRNGAQVTGVRTNTGIYPLTSNGRVILSAGSFGSPRILFQSGIGPTDQIQQVQKNARQASYLPAQNQWINLPVGYNVSDNPSINIVMSQPTVDSYNNWDTVFTAPPAADVSQYVKSRAGVLAAPSPRLNFWRAYGASDKRTRYAQGTVKPGAGDSLATSQSYNTSQLFTITVYLSQGLTSRGRIGITTTGSMQALVNPWFQDPIDQQVIINAVQDVINESKADSTIKVLVPDLTQMSVSDYVKNYPASNLCSNHWVGSNSIGQVVDANLKVFNTNNLFVVDASIFPALPMGNPHGAIMSAVEQGVANILALSGGP